MQDEKYGERLLSDMRAYLENPFGVVESDALGDLLKFVREHVNTLGFFYGKARGDEAKGRVILARNICKLYLSILEEVDEIVRALSLKMETSELDFYDIFIFCGTECRTRIPPLLERYPAEISGIDRGKMQLNLLYFLCLQFSV